MQKMLAGGILGLAEHIMGRKTVQEEDPLSYTF
jgi:hypothetical protein